MVNYEVILDYNFFELIANHYRKRLKIKSKINIVLLLDEYHKMADYQQASVNKLISFFSTLIFNENPDDSTGFKPIFIFSGLDSLPLIASKSNIEVYYIPVKPLTFEIASAIATTELGNDEFLLNESAVILVWALSSNPKKIVETCKLIKNRHLNWEDQLSSILLKVDSDRVSDSNLQLFFSLIAAHFSGLSCDKFINDSTQISKLNVVFPQSDGKVFVSIYGLIICCRYCLFDGLPPSLLKFERLLKSVYNFFDESFCLTHSKWKKIELLVVYLLSCIINSLCLTILPKSNNSYTADELFFDIIFPTDYKIQFNLCPVEVVVDVDISKNHFEPGNICWWNGAQVGIDTLVFFENSYISDQEESFDIFLFIQNKLIFDSGLTLSTFKKCQKTCIEITSKYRTLNPTKNVAYLLIIIDSVKDISVSLKKELKRLNKTYNNNFEIFAALGKDEFKNFSTSIPPSPCIPSELFINADKVTSNNIMLFLPSHWNHRKEIALQLYHLKNQNYYYFNSWSDICSIAKSLYPNCNYELIPNLESVKFKSIIFIVQHFVIY